MTREDGTKYNLFWAKFNLGAKAPADPGSSFAWGETETKEKYGWSNYKWGNSETGPFSKYDPNSSDEDVNKTVLDPEDDAAYVILGGKWRMPTEAEWAELMKVYPKPYYHDEVTYDGVTYGDRNDSQKSIYLREGGYWSSNLNTNDPSTAMYVYMSYVQGMTTLPRSQPLPIRPVYED